MNDQPVCSPQFIDGRTSTRRQAMPMDIPVGPDVPQEPLALTVLQSRPQLGGHAPHESDRLAPVTAPALGITGDLPHHMKQLAHRHGGGAQQGLGVKL